MGPSACVRLARCSSAPPSPWESPSSHGRGVGGARSGADASASPRSRPAQTSVPTGRARREGELLEVLTRSLRAAGAESWDRARGVAGCSTPCGMARSIHTAPACDFDERSYLGGTREERMTIALRRGRHPRLRTELERLLDAPSRIRHTVCLRRDYMNAARLARLIACSRCPTASAIDGFPQGNQRTCASVARPRRDWGEAWGPQRRRGDAAQWGIEPA